MRRFQLGSLLLCLMLLVSGCSAHHRFGSDPDIVYPTNHAIMPVLMPGRFGGDLASANAGDPKTFNQWVAEDAYSSFLAGMLSDSLETRNGFTLQFEYHLAYKPKVTGGGKIWTYTLKPGLVWSDGQPITADDIIFTLDVLFDPKIETLSRDGLLISVTSPSGKITQVPFKYKKLDDRTVQFTLPIVWAPAEESFGFSIMPKHCLEAAYKTGQFNNTWGVDTPPSQLVSCGPYTMAQYVPQQRVIFKRNPRYWRYADNGQHEPYLDTFTYSITADQNGEALNFRSAGSDVFYPLPPQFYPSFARYAKRDNYTLVDCGPDWGTGFFTFNENPDSTMSKDKPLLSLFQNKLFRQACSYAMDRPTICKNLGLGLSRPSYGPDSPADTIFYDAKAPTYPYNPAKATELLTGIGCKRGADGMLTYQGEPIKFTIITSVESAGGVAAGTIINNDWRKIGLGSTLAPVTFDNLDTKIESKPYDWQVVYLGFGGGPEPNDLADLWRSSAVSHIWHPKETTPSFPWEKQIDDDFTHGAQTLDINQRKKYYYDWQEVVGDQQPMLYVQTPEYFMAMRNHFGNVQPSSVGLFSAYGNLDQIYNTRATRTTP